MITQTQNQYLHLLIDPSFQRVNRIFVFENKINLRSYKWYYISTVEIKITILWSMEEIFLISQ